MEATSEDLELLEAFLDGELDAPQTAAVSRRLEGDPMLGAALADLQRQRQLRAAVWKALEPDARAAEQLVWRVRGAAAEHRRGAGAGSATAVNDSPRQVRWSVMGVARWSAAAVACVVVGFGIGRIGRGGHNLASGASDTSQQVRVADGDNSSTPPPLVYPTGYPFQLPADNRHTNEDDFMHGAPVQPAAPGFSDDRVKLSSDEKVEQKF